MGEADYKRMRREYLVDPGYQLRFVTRLLVTVMAVAILSAAIASGLLWKNLFAPELAHQTSLITGLISVATTLLVELLLAIPIVLYFGIIQSHRIVGPMNRMRQTLEAISQGDFSQRITLRRGDALEDLAHAINQVAESLQAKFPKNT
jgi:methyl-accepting chemotaxis protein